MLRINGIATWMQKYKQKDSAEVISDIFYAVTWFCFLFKREWQRKNGTLDRIGTLGRIFIKRGLTSSMEGWKEEKVSHGDTLPSNWYL